MEQERNAGQHKVERECLQEKDTTIDAVCLQARKLQCSILAAA